MKLLNARPPTHTHTRIESDKYKTVVSEEKVQRSLFSLNMYKWMCVNRLAWSKIALKVGRAIRFKEEHETAKIQQNRRAVVAIIFGKIQAISIKYLDISLRLWRSTNKCFIIKHVRLQCAFHKYRNGMKPISAPLRVYRLLVFVTFQLQSNIVAFYCVAEIIVCAEQQRQQQQLLQTPQYQ